MGWLTYNRPKGETDRDHFQAKMSPGYRIVECATVNSVFYAAVRDNDGEVSAFVALIHRAPNSYYNFGYKDMDENMGPGACEAPARVLDALTPTEHPYAVEWRKQCRDTIARKAKAKAVKPGTYVELDRPVTFSNGQSVSRFQRCSERGQWQAVTEAGWRFRCRLNINRYDWTVAS
jgi:hypothetical protein